MNGSKLDQIRSEVEKGNKECFNQIVDEYEDKIFGFINSIIKDNYHSEDLTQEVFIRVYNNIHQFDDTKKFSTWILTIARNISYDHLRKKSRISVCADLDHVSNDLPEDVVLAKEYNESVDKYVQMLPDNLRVLIHLKYFEEMSYKEISLSLGLEVKTVRSQLYEARKKLLRSIETGEVISWNVK